MINIYTIGFSGKSAEKFFALLKKNNIRLLIDARLNNKSQLAAFTKGKDLEFFLKEILEIGYKHILDFAPTQQILAEYREKKINWDEYTIAYNELLIKRKVEKLLPADLLDKSCILCSEPEATKCHRRLLVEYLESQIPDINILHL